MLFTLDWLLKQFPNTTGQQIDHQQIDLVTTDSRESQENGLFIPLIGDRFDAHDYAEQAVKNGSIAVLWNENKDIPKFLMDYSIVILVEDTLKALQRLAKLYREHINPLVIGITGSNGKTTTKDIVATVLETSFKTHKTAGNFNNHIGMPLTILSMPQETEILILEMGMNHFDEISFLSNLAEPDYAIVTNIGESHIEYLGSRAGIAKAKLEILDGLKNNGTLIFDGDEPLLKEQITLRREKFTSISCGFNSSQDFTIEVQHIDKQQTVFKLNEDKLFQVPLHGKHHAKNATYAIALAKSLKISDEKIQTGFDNLTITQMRFEWLTGKNDVNIINDAYNASPTSMKAAIDVVKDMKDFTTKVLVLGDIYELGSQSEELHRSVASVIDDSIHVLFTYGEMAHVICEEVLNGHNKVLAKHFDELDELIDALQPYLNDENLILFKASRGMQFEKIIERVTKIQI